MPMLLSTNTTSTASTLRPRVKVKASGGISTLEDAERFIELGAERLGTSRIVKLAMSQGYDPDAD